MIDFYNIITCILDFYTYYYFFIIYSKFYL